MEQKVAPLSLHIAAHQSTNICPFLIGYILNDSYLKFKSKLSSMALKSYLHVADFKLHQF